MVSTVTPAMGGHGAGGIGFTQDDIVNAGINNLTKFISEHDITAPPPDQRASLDQIKVVSDFLRTQTSFHAYDTLIVPLLLQSQAILDAGVFPQTSSPTPPTNGPALMPPTIIRNNAGEQIFRYTPELQTFIVDFSDWDCMIESSILTCTQTNN